MDIIKQSSFEKDFTLIKNLEKTNLTEASEDESVNRSSDSVGDTSNFVFRRSSNAAVAAQQQSPHNSNNTSPVVAVDSFTECIVLHSLASTPSTNNNRKNSTKTTQTTYPHNESMWLVSNKETNKRFNARKLTFKSENDAIACSEMFLGLQEFVHDFLVPIHQVYIDRNSIFVLKQRYPDSLSEFVTSRATKAEQPDLFEEVELLDVLKMVSSALHHLYSYGFVHALGEISMERVYASNWSYSEFVLDSGNCANNVNAQYYQDRKQTLLKNAYIAPELRKNLKNNQFEIRVTERSEVFSVGVIFFSLATLCTSIGEVFLVSNYLDIVKNRIKETDLSNRSKTMLLKMLHESPSKRPSMSDVIKFVELSENRPVEQAKSLPQKGVKLSGPKAIFSRLLSGLSRKPDPNVSIQKVSKKLSKAQEIEAEAYVLFRGRSLMEGQMRRSINNGSSWQTEYFYLTDYHYLYICKNIKDPWSVKQKYLLTPGSFFVTPTTATKGAKGEFFKLTTESEKLLFGLDSDALRDKWIQVLKNLGSTEPRIVPDTVDLSEELESDAVLETSQDYEQIRFMERLQQVSIIPNMRVIAYSDVSIVEKLGFDGLGMAYIVDVHNKLENKTNRIFMKELEEHTMTDGEFAEFLNEVSIITSLHHSNILQFKGMCFERDRLCLFAEYAGKGTIERLLAVEHLDFGQRLQLLKQIATAMNHLHTREPAITHRDLQPDSILCDSNNCVKITNFGFSRIRNKTVGRRTQRLRSNFKYMAPEKFSVSTKTVQADMAGDVFSFGMIAYELLTNRKVFPDLIYPVAIVNAITDGERPDFPEQTELSDESVSLYNQAKLIIQKCWDTLPDNRPSFIEVENCLNKL